MSTQQTELPLDTRRAAREQMEGTGRAQHLRETVLAALKQVGPKTADELADYLNESPLSIRPRFSELNKLGAIVDTGERRRNRSGNTAKVWRAPDGE